MKKFLLLFFTLILSISAFAIVDFSGINWKNSKGAIAPLFANLKEEPSIDPNIKIFSATAPDKNISNYKFYFNNDELYMIRVIFNKETVRREQMKKIYSKLTSTLGKPLPTKIIDKKIGNYKLRGNYIKFIPDATTGVYYIGVDTIDSKGNMIDSNLYLDYVDQLTVKEPQL